MFIFHFSRIFSTGQFNKFHVNQHSKCRIANMAKSIDLEPKRKLLLIPSSKHVNWIFWSLWKAVLVLFLINPVNFEHSIMKEKWPRFKIISEGNLAVTFLHNPCILFGVKVKPTGVIKLFFDYATLFWEHVNNIPSRPLNSITKGPEYAVTRYFSNSSQTDMDFRHCLSPLWFNGRVITMCMGWLIKCSIATFAQIEIGGGVPFALLNIGNKFWCAGTSSTTTHLFERCCCSPKGFTKLLQLSFREREVGYLHFSIQRPGDLIYIPHLLAHAVSTLDTGSPKILSGWDAATTSNEQFIIQTLDEYDVGMRRGKWREIFLKKIYQQYGNVSFLLQQTLKKVRGGYKNIGIFGNNIVSPY